MQYRSVRDLAEHVREWSERLPPDLDLVVGIPRSGLLVANLLALYRNVAMTDVDGLLAGRLLSAGKRTGARPDILSDERRLRILVADDSLWSGGQLGQVRARIAAANLPHEVMYGAVYVVPESTALVDTYHSKVPVPRVFEWNILHHPDALALSCVSFEALLGSPAPGQAAAAAEGSFPPPRLRPTHKIGCVVATQPPQVEARIAEWLGRHCVEYDDLVLVPPTATSSDAVVREKAAIYRSRRAWLFLEATHEAAARLALAAHRPVFALDTWDMLYPGLFGSIEKRPPLWMRASLRLRQEARKLLVAAGVR